ncbi:MAG TPA: hypothetical protein VGT42_02725 [Gammaproteobacteria bacterium]|nr:hypothetical protein [Gammaproteobacteria bacterium]
MKSSQVRELARRYAAGQLNQENYRSQRRALIDAVTGGQQPLVYKDIQAANSMRRGGVKLLALGVVALLAIGIAVSLALKSPGGVHGGTTKAPTSMPAAPVGPPPSPGPALVRTFVEANDWNDDSLDTFTHRWAGLPADEQSKARDSLMYPRLVSELRGQIISEKAVSNGSADPHLAALQKMAKALGVSSAS